MKDCWRAQIENTWRVLPLKRIFRIVNGSTPRVGDESSWDGDIFWATPEDLGSLDGSTIRETRRRLTKTGYESCGTTLMPAGSIILSTRAPIGHLAIAGAEMCTNQGCKGLIPRGEDDTRFYYYLLQAACQELQSRGQGTTFQELGYQNLATLPVPQPDIREQREIADFLDRKTQEIDGLIKKKLRLIQLFTDRRTSLISIAVTGGLGKDGPRKHCGIETIGEIPAHWEVLRTKLLFRDVDERTESGDEELLSVSHITGVTPRSEKPDVNMFMAETLEGYKRCQKNDLVINTMWAWMGALGFSRYNGLVSPSYNVYRLKREAHPEYFDYLYRTPYYITEITRWSKGVWSSRLRLYPDSFFEILTILPPIEEQRQITELINKETGHYENAISMLRQSCDQLAEYRSSLIFAAVTGKVTPNKTETLATTTRANPYFKRAVLAAEIVHQLQGDVNLGRTKLQKLLFICEHHAHLSDLASNYLRQAAGPYDSQMMHSVESQIEKQRWYRCQPGNGAEYHYVPLEAAGQHTKYFERYWSDKSDSITKVVALLKKADTRQSEIVATLYAAWNDLLLAGQSVTDGAILNEVLYKWHEKKRQIPEKRWRDAIAWMRQRDLIPRGFGNPTRQKSSQSADGK